jgi:hypothetical protein
MAVGDDAPLREFYFPWRADLFSLPGRFISLPGRRNSLPTVLGNWLAEALIYFTIFAGFAGKIDEIFDAQGKSGNLSAPGKRLVVGPGPEGCGPLRWSANSSIPALSDEPEHEREQFPQEPR